MCAIGMGRAGLRMPCQRCLIDYQDFNQPHACCYFIGRPGRPKLIPPKCTGSLAFMNENYASQQPGQPRHTPDCNASTRGQQRQPMMEILETDDFILELLHLLLRCGKEMLDAFRNLVYKLARKQTEPDLVRQVQGLLDDHGVGGRGGIKFMPIRKGTVRPAPSDDADDGDDSDLLGRQFEDEGEEEDEGTKRRAGEDDFILKGEQDGSLFTYQDFHNRLHASHLMLWIEHMAE
ncbi:unnamed protein product [Vitrella brassicaformis CCMP3155]|uniref:Uncharacterized protein n=1 Tax=Vitrella brassicaformis (strain CCMP3155) TaxID=1169540 RepID=A0A0G4GAE9_VITBC|nr:unnamed protein product [Vitrella brassicaformis CCMP3155]|eukprot:CEM25954.1 unnamed protein product [Vitrella brassicaformis CCMP3155]